ncbi:MFS transporter [Actinomadura litoris]|uniref:MFS transporter n=1 Tax=Actinomadura litoris TaxID=2678616 RepID=UPI001FA74539|nr:MFS transporter [Actinomadura litoris]
MTQLADGPVGPGRLGFLGTGRGRIVLALLCLVAFVDLVDASIVNVALPAMKEDLDFSQQSLQWVPSGYLLTYGGFMLLGGRFADLLGRRRVLVAGTALFGVASVLGGLAQNEQTMVAARLAQGLGAALMSPAALSVLTTAFVGRDRAAALGVWGGVAGAASAIGVLAGGALTDGPGWRWVMWVNPPAVAVIVAGALWLLADDRRKAAVRTFDLPGAVLVTGGMLLLVYALVEAPEKGWGTARTWTSIAGALVLLALFTANEARSRNPLLPLSIFKIRGLPGADVAQFVAMAGFIAMFFFLSLYMQLVLHYSPVRTGLAYLPLTVAVGAGSGLTAGLIPRVGTRPLIIAGLLVGAAGMGLLARCPVEGGYVRDLLPGLVVVGVGLALVFVAVTTAANAGVPADRAGLAAALINASSQVGGALGLAVFSAMATSRTDDLLAAGAAPAVALTEGFQRALLGAAAFIVAAAVIALRATNTRGEHQEEHDAPSPAVSEAAERA